MKKLILSVFVSQIACLIFAQSFKGEFDASQLPQTRHHYQDEFVSETVVNPQAWNGQAGLHAVFGSPDRLYFRKEVPIVGNNATTANYTAWKGERVNMQVMVWSSDTLLQVRFETEGLKNAAGHTISREQIRMNMVRYVISDYPYGAKDVVCGNSPYKNGFLMPDRFEPFDRFDLPGKTSRPVWISLDIPADADPGPYKGIIKVKTDKYATELNVSVKVQKQMLPKPSEWTHRLDLWQNSWAVAWYNHLKPWSDEHKMLLKQHLALYANAGGTYITTYAVHSPWSDNSFMPEGGMIEWVRQKDGNWRFDYTIFDEYVQLAMECGINKAITIYTAIPWGNRFRYTDENTGNYEYVQWEPGTADFEKHWNIFLTDLKKHLLQKGWFGITYIGINENEMEQTLAAIKTVKAHSADWKITYAGNWHQQLDTWLDDYSFLATEEPNTAELKARQGRGQTSTYYVCCNPPAPNNFVFSPPIEGRWISWYTSARGYNGFLRWAYDAWPEDPNRDARHGSWAAGDCFLVYPGGHSGIRFEKLREGIVEFEKIAIIREKVAKSGNSKVKKLWQDFEKHLAAFTSERTFDETKMTQDVYKGKAFIDSLSDLLND